jgi:hypothetical protein
MSREQDLEDLIGEVSLYINQDYVMRRLDQGKKELMCQAVRSWQTRLNDAKETDQRNPEQLTG